MTTYRLFPSTPGPSSPISNAGAFLAGVLFEVTTGGMWFEGYWWWVCPSGQSTSAQKFALWNVTGAGAGTLVPGSVVTSGTLTAGQWNYVPLGTPLQLSLGTTYNACTGFTGSFPDSDTGTDAANSYGTGGHTSGITNGPLHAFSDQPYSSPEPYGNVQGVFSSTSGSDPSAAMPTGGSNSGNFWMDLQAGDTAPPGYAGSYRLYPSKYDANPATVADLNVNYVVATEIHLSQPCVLDAIWYYSPPGTAQLATSCDIWSPLTASTGTSVARSSSPSWSGAAGSGWVSCTFGNVTLPAGTYKVSVFNDNATPDGWSAKDANTNYWDAGAGSAGITNGPLSAPGLAAASTAYVYDGAGGGNTPPFSTAGGTTEPGQCTFCQPVAPPGPDQYPYLYVDGLAQNYWTDAEVTPAAAPSAPTRAAGGRRRAVLAEAYRFTR